MNESKGFSVTLRLCDGQTKLEKEECCPCPFREFLLAPLPVVPDRKSNILMTAPTHVPGLLSINLSDHSLK